MARAETRCADSRSPPSYRSATITAIMSAPQDIPLSSSPSNTRSEGPFKRLVRSLSRSGRRTDSNGQLLSPSPKQEYPPRSSSKNKGGPPSPGALGMSTSPPPDSYFPKPPRGVLQDGEASGVSRHPDSLGARAADVAPTASGQSAPGVSFAPQAPSDASRAQRTKEELEGWSPAPRRSNSQRVVRRPSENGGAQKERPKGRGRATSSSTAVDGKEEDEKETLSEVRRGVQLEDKPLSRKTSVKRAASALKKATASAFTFEYQPAAKGEGETRVLVLMADGTEEIELVTVYDVLVRSSLSPTLVSVSPQFSPSQSLPYVTLSRGAKMMADTQFETLKEEHKEDFDAIIIPGGAKGAERLSKSPAVLDLIRSFHEQGKLVGMICAGTLAAKAAGIAMGERVTSHPSVRKELEEVYRYSEDRVVVSGNLVTSRGPGTALEWSLRIVEILAGKEKRDEVEGPMMV